MEPKTKLQREIFSLSAKIPKLNERQLTWIREHIYTHYVYQNRSKIGCLECGHTWKADKPYILDKLQPTVCPECGTILKVHTSLGSSHRDSCYVSLMNTIKGFQVCRMFFFRERFHFNHPVERHIEEVYQQWLSPEGKSVVLSLKVFAYSHYYDQWIFGTPLSVSSNPDHIRYDTSPYKILPGNHYLPLLRRNGFNGNVYNWNPMHFFQVLLSDPHFETLVKARQTHLIRLYSYSSREMQRYWPSIRICLRNQFEIDTPNVWFDYLALLVYFNKDILSPRYICNPDYKKEHDRLVKLKLRKIRQENILKLKSQMDKDNKVYVRKIQWLQDVKITGEGITILPLRTVQSYLLEGDIMGNCLFTNEYYKRKNSLVFIAIRDHVHLEVLEFNFYTWKVLQCYGPSNEETADHHKILDLFRAHIPQLKRRKRDFTKKKEKQLIEC